MNWILFVMDSLVQMTEQFWESLSMFSIQLFPINPLTHLQHRTSESEISNMKQHKNIQQRWEVHAFQ
jgi:hypothetical protein